MPDLWARLRRKTSNGSFIPEIDGLRFLAIFGVVAFHLMLDLFGKLEALGQSPDSARAMFFASKGALGVELFFVLSGLILGIPFAAQRLAAGPPVRLRRYFWRRLTRLEPPFLISLAICLPAIAYTTGYTLRELIVPTLVEIPYAYGLIYRAHNPVNTVLWSLEIEAQFYVLAPVLASAFLIRRKWLRRTVLIGAVALCVAPPWSWVMPTRGDAFVRYTILPYLSFFVVGLLLADIYVTDWERSPRRGHLGDAVFAAAAVTTFLVPRELAGIVLPGVFGLIVWGAFRGRIVRRALTVRGVTTIGGMCYSIYLMHYLVLAPVMHRMVLLTQHLPFEVQFLLQLVLTGVPTLLFTGAFYVLVERPCMDPEWPQKLKAWLRRTFRREQEEPVPEARA